MLRSFDVGIDNLACCDFDGATIHRWSVDSIRADGRGLCASLMQHLAAVGAAGVERVVIEAQSKRSAKLLAVQNWLEAYYTLQGLPVVVFSARHKLQGTGQENRGRANYRARKKAAVALCTAWLQAHPQAPEVHAFYEGCKKKDDAADAALMAMAFLGRAEPLQAPPPRVVARRPTLRQAQTGRYSRSNLKHIVLKDWACADSAALAARLVGQDRVRRALRKHFGTVEACWECLQSA